MSSSLLNVSNASNKSEEFSVNDIEMLADKKEQNWFKRAHIGQYLGIARIITSNRKLSEEDKRSRAFLQAEGESVAWTPPPGKMLRIIIFSSCSLVLFMSWRRGVVVITTA